MKILVGSIQQETNTFSNLSSDRNDFFIASGDAMLDHISVCDVFRSSGAQIFPTIYANAVPSGRLRLDVFNSLLDDLLCRIPDQKIDGIWLYLHGALLLENDRSGELEILKAIRKKAKGDPVIALTLDFHANLPESITKYAHIICGYKTAPHRDIKDTQILSAELLVKSIKAGSRPHSTLIKLPLMLPGDTVLTSDEPMRNIMCMAEEVRKTFGFWDISVFPGQSWVDCAHSGAGVVVNSDGSSRSVERSLNAAIMISESLWEIRGSFVFKENALMPDKAVETAWCLDQNAVFVSDSGDNPTAGASSRRTDLLVEMLEYGVHDSVFGAVWDRDFVDFYRDKDIGYASEMKLGENFKNQKFNSKLKSKGKILNWDGVDGGMAVIAEIDGIDVIVTENRISIISVEIYRSVGIDINKYRLIAVKLGYLYPDLEKAAKAHYIALTNGESCVNIESLPFVKLGRPVFPIDRKAKFILEGSFVNIEGENAN